MNMINVEVIINKIKEGFSDRGFFIVEILINLNKQIIILIDSEKGININECAEISRYLAHNLGTDIEEYEVQVSSPGLDKGFKVIEQYRKNKGKLIEVVKKDGIKVIGTLSTISDEFIELNEKVKLKSTKNEEMRSFKIEFSEIKTTKEVIKIN
jgi:ribosome maturation factor RimP